MLVFATQSFVVLIRFGSSLSSLPAKFVIQAGCLVGSTSEITTQDINVGLDDVAEIEEVFDSRTLDLTARKLRSVRSRRRS